MAAKWHEISWEEKHYFNNVTHGNYGDPVHALYDVDETGRPLARDLSKAGLKHYGYELPEDIKRRKKIEKKEEERRKKIEKKAEEDREKSKDEKGCCPSSSICDSISCSIKSITSVFSSLSE